MSGITRAVVDHAEEIARVHVAAWHGAYEGLLPAELLLAQSVENRAEAWKRHLRDAAVAVWVAEAGGGVIEGFVAAGPSRDDDAPPATGELYAIYVHPDSWGTGVGYSLFTAAIRALAADYDTATLWVLDGNSRACRFYERQGWIRDGTHRQEARGSAFVDEARYCGWLLAVE